MAKYHVGCGITGIFAGTLNKMNTMWVNKSDVTDEAIRAVAQFLLEHEEVMKFNYQGRCYRLAVEPQESEVEVLDKIRVDIEELDRYYDNDYFSTNNCPMYKCNEVLKIIDKYRGE